MSSAWWQIRFPWRFYLDIKIDLRTFSIALIIKFTQISTKPSDQNSERRNTFVDKVNQLRPCLVIIRKYLLGYFMHSKLLTRDSDLVMCRKQPGIAIGRLCDKCDGKCPVCDSYVRPTTLVRICDECSFGNYQNKCAVCGGEVCSSSETFRAYSPLMWRWYRESQMPFTALNVHD